MRVIDLLNKIANGEDVPKKIKYRKCIFEYEEKYKEYFTKNGIIPTTFDTNGIFRNIFLDYNNCLNDEVEIIEEDKKIRKIKVDYSPDIEEKIFYEDGDKPNHCILGDAGTELLINKINEIIDILNEMREDK